jgi:uncharacterized repeat protein (TIGR01451 family)
MNPLPLPRRPLTSTRLLLAAALAVASGAATASPTLQPSGVAPTELQLGEYAVFTLAINNTGTIAASGVVLRMPLPAGLDLQGPPHPTCSLFTGQFPGLPGQTRQIRCNVGNVSARRSKSFSLVVKAPTMPMLNVPHSVLATATNAATRQSPVILANYQHYDVPITPGLTWEMKSCNNGTAGPLAYSICPPHSEVGGEIVLAAGGYLTDADGQVGPTERWLQTSPHVLRIDWSGGYTNFSAIDSKCLRGPGQTLPQPGQPVYYLASKICRL